MSLGLKGGAKSVDKAEKEHYEKLIPKLRKAMEYLDDPERTKEEIDRWMPAYKLIFKEVTELERMIRNANV